MDEDEDATRGNSEEPEGKGSQEPGGCTQAKATPSQERVRGKMGWREGRQNRKGARPKKRVSSRAERRTQGRGRRRQETLEL